MFWQVLCLLHCEFADAAPQQIPVFSPIHVSLIQVTEESEFVLSLPDVLQSAPPFANSSLLFVGTVQL